MSLTLDLLTRRRALAGPVIRLACALGFLAVGGYAAAADATDAPASADESSAVGAGAEGGERIRPFHIHVSASLV